MLDALEDFFLALLMALFSVLESAHFAGCFIIAVALSFLTVSNLYDKVLDSFEDIEGIISFARFLMHAVFMVTATIAVFAVTFAFCMT